MQHTLAIRRTAVVLLSAGALVGAAATAQATQGGDHQPWICHPVEGNGETGYGWNLIDPDKASSHIDETTGEGKHTRSDGRTDVYADEAGHCPGYVVVTPTPTPSESESPTPEPSESESPTPEPSESESPTPEPSESESPTPEPSESESPTPEPSETITSPAPTPTLTGSPIPPPTQRPIPSRTYTRGHTESPSPSDSPSSSVTPSDDPTTPASSTQRLAQTGSNTGPLVWLAAALVIAGLILVAAGRDRTPTPVRPREH